MLLLFALIGVALSGQPAPEVSEREIVERAAAYVRSYQQQLTSILADELYSQQILEQTPYDKETPRTRLTKSELFFMFAPAGDGWMAIRDVMSINGRPVGNRPDLREALRLLPATDVAQKFKDYNSRFNLGRIYRNFNEPTLSLLVLDDRHRHRFSFDQKRVERSGDVTLVTLAFTERQTPTLIRDLKLGHVFSRGELIVDAATGLIRRATLSASIGPVKIELTTTYAADVRLDMWVPVTFREQYEHGVSAGDSRTRLLNTRSEYESIICEATYTNYRRFETAVRIR
jgi:hypothetical protein